MTRADHQRLLPWLGLMALLAAALMAALAMGWGRQVEWLPPLGPAAVTANASEPPAPPLPLAAYANTWAHPLFSPDRQPDAPVTAADGPASLQGLTLTGSLITDHLRVALLKDGNGKPVSLTEGKALANGWVLQQLEPTEATFVSGDQQQRLQLRTERPPLRAAPVAGQP